MKQFQNHLHTYSFFKAAKILPVLLLVILTLLTVRAQSQVVNETTKKKISIGFGLYTDIWMNMPKDINQRWINQGVNVFATYNVPFGKSNFSFAIGLGICTHNLYGDFLVNSTSDSTVFKKIPDSVGYKRSKMTLAFVEVPVEFRWKSKSKVTVALGFKGGFMVGSFTKYVGDSYSGTNNYNTVLDPVATHEPEKVRVKYWGVKNLESFAYGPTLRVGYKWINLNAYYQLSTVFTKGNNPEMYPISVGLVLMPF
jgi:hypothetical protein